MKMRKIITGLLSLAFVFSMSLNSMAFAEEVVTEVEVVTTQAKSEEFVISLGTVDVEYADQDQVVSIPVSVDANPGFAAALIDFALPEGMEIVGLKDGLITDLAYNASRVIWVNGVSGDFKENGVLFYVDVLVPAGSSDLYEISVISHEESFVDSEYNTCVPAMASGAVNILGAPEVTTITDVTEPEVTTVTDVTEPEVTTVTDVTEPEVTTATDVTEPTVTTKVTKEHNCGNKPGHHKKDKKPKCEKPQVTEPVATEQVVVKPVETEPVVVKPVEKTEVIKPERTRPEFTKPERTRPEKKNKEVTEPEVTIVTEIAEEV